MSLRRLATPLEAPVDGASLGIFRIVFGVAMAVDAWRYLAYGWVDVLYVRPLVHFHYYGFEWVEPWPGIGMQLHFWLISVLALLVAAGVFYRLAAALLFIAYLYVFLLDQAAYMNHHYLMLLIAFLLAWMPADNSFSLRKADAIQKRRGSAANPVGAELVEARGGVSPHRANTPPQTGVPLWSIWILRFQLVVVYVYGAIAKLDADWLRGEPMRTTLTRMAESDWPQLGGAVAAAVAYAIAYLGLLADLAIPTLLLMRRTRWLGLAIAILFHGANAVWLDIGIFSYVMLGLLPIFFDPDWPRRVFGGERLTLLPRQPTHPLVLIGLVVYAGIQLAMPLRHHLYPGNVSWTEEGHRLSWRMMLRTKRSQLYLQVTDPASGRSWSINPANDLTSVQLRELETDPDVVLQYVHFHRDRLRREGVANPEIRVIGQSSLNGRPQQALIDPTVDLAPVERSLLPADWILPLAIEPHD